MLPSSHLAAGYILAYLFYSVGFIHGLVFWLVILASVLIDIDYFVKHMHRELFTHTPAFWLVVFTPLVLWNNELVIVLLAIMLHFSMDMVDGGIMVFYPFSKKDYGLKLLPELESKSPINFLRGYLSNAKMVIVEVVIICLAVLLAMVNYFD
ncbi:MAG: metal-dependent hydrolase [Candidatus Hadarchaeota archaeon]